MKHLDTDYHSSTSSNDSNNNDIIPTQFLFHKNHYEIFGWIFPPQIKNWQCDNFIYNIYNRMNAYSISFRDSETVPGTTEAVQLSLFGIIPAITWNFKF